MGAHCKFDVSHCLLLLLREPLNLNNDKEDMGSGVQQANTPPQLSLYFLWCLSAQQPWSVQEGQVSPTKFSSGPATTLSDRGPANLCVKELTAQNGVGSRAFPTVSLPEQNQSDLSRERERLPA